MTLILILLLILVFGGGGGYYAYGRYGGGGLGLVGLILIVILVVMLVPAAGIGCKPNPRRQQTESLMARAPHVPDRANRRNMVELMVAHAASSLRYAKHRRCRLG